MQSFTQYSPTEIVFGREAQKEAGKMAKNGEPAERFWSTEAGAL